MDKKEHVVYLDKSRRATDDEYVNLIARVLLHGKEKGTIHATLKENVGSGHQYALEKTGEKMSFALERGFPLVSVRDLNKTFYGCLGELIAFLNGARTLKDLVRYGCPEFFWKSWVTAAKCKVWGLKEGDLGPGSYGPTLRSLPDGSNGTFDQVGALIRSIKKYPNSRCHMISSWFAPLALGDPEGTPRQVVVAPCHGSILHFTIFPELGEIELVHFQRSADICVGLQFNMIQWCAFGLMVAYITGYQLSKYTHMIGSAQIYDIQEKSARQILNNSTGTMPKVYIKPGLKRDYPWEFKPEDFVIEEYDPYPFFKIPTPI
jgi:thymidylate synthase